MSEPLAEHLSRFTPDPTGLDRDALLFAAGRASARANRKWQALVGTLALSQVLTLVLLWPRTPPSQTPLLLSGCGVWECFRWMSIGLNQSTTRR
jgi:hypothetical protein